MPLTDTAIRNAILATAHLPERRNIMQEWADYLDTGHNL